MLDLGLPPLSSPLLIGAAGIASYLLLVRALRFRRYNAIHAKYAKKFAGKGALELEEAQEIIFSASFYEMPLLLNYALAFALFKTYGIPSISKLLYQTKELSTAENISRRYADTEILISSWVACPISGRYTSGACPAGNGGFFKDKGDPRASIALARVNWLHSRYKISNDDFLYTLALFILEPIDWAKRYGWRSLSPMEEYAFFAYWRVIGKNMGIQDIPDTLEDLRIWSNNYEERHMVPAETNRDVANFTSEEIIHLLPERFGIKNFGRRLSTCLLDDRVRIAMMKDAQPWYLHALIKGSIHLVNQIHLYLCLPRWKPSAILDQGFGDGTGRMHPTRWQPKPWYKPKSKGIGHLKDRLAVWVGLYEELPSEKLKCGGYRLEELGPIRFEKSGHQEVMHIAEKIYGRPIPDGPWALPNNPGGNL